MGFKDLPKDLIATATSILDYSAKQNQKLYEKTYAEALGRFGIKSIDELSEPGKKEFDAWFTRQCANVSLTEDDMPDDAVYHKGGGEEGPKKREIDDEVECDESEGDAEDQVVSEAIAERPDEVADNEALGCRTETELPKHVDVLVDSNPVDGIKEYRLFVQFPTNTRTVIIPPPTLPGAPSVSALRELVEDLPYAAELERAIADAESLPANDPAFRGNDKE